MSWRDLLSANESLVLPWVGGRRLRVDERIWALEGKRPQEHCWGKFLCKTNRTATFEEIWNPQPETLKYCLTGYLVGDRLVMDNARVDPDPQKIAEQTEEVFLLDAGLDRFARVSAGRLFDEGPLIFKSQEFPLGPEAEVLGAFLEDKPIAALKGVTPALEAAYRMEAWHKELAERRREEVRRIQKEEQERRDKELRRQMLVEQLGDGAGRRQMAYEDFGEAARAALTIGGAVYLDHRKATWANEMVVTFRLQDRRFECTCDKTLRIIDAGICLNAHHDDPDFEAGTKGDTYFTLESLPLVILQAQREGKLVVFRHVD